MVEVLSTLLCCFWLLSALAIAFTQIIMSTTFDYVPNFVKQLFLFGKLKSSLGKSQGMEFLLVPKRWFIHFYGLGVVVHSLVLMCTFLHIYDCLSLTEWLPQRSFLQSSYNVHKDKMWPSTLIVMLMEWFQICRRLYESIFISSFSNSTMSLVHYLFGLFLYSSFGVGLLLRVDLDNCALGPIQFNESIPYLIGVSLFAFASFGQHKSMITFAALRSERKENPILGHHIPRGHLFEWISSPHYLCEIVIYSSMSIVFAMEDLYVNSVLAFVTVNQVCSSIMVHEWYKKNFAKYPSNRKALIPYVL